MLHRGARSDVADRSWHFFGLPSLRSPELKRTQLDHKLWLPQWGCGERPPLTRTYLPKKNGRAQSEGIKANSVLARSYATTTPVLLAGRVAACPRKVALAKAEKNAVVNPMH